MYVTNNIQFYDELYRNFFSLSVKQFLSSIDSYTPIYTHNGMMM